MLSASNSDIFNIIGTSEINSFHNTLNEMLTVWNEPSFGQQQLQQQLQQQQQSSPQLSESSISNILQNNGSYFNLPIPQISLRTSSKGLHNQIRTLMANKAACNNNNNILSTSQQLETLFLENSILNKTIDGNDSQFGKVDSNNINNNNNGNEQNDILKTINEISYEQKSYQPIEITPYKITNSSGSTGNLLGDSGNNNSSNNINNSNNNINQFVIDPIKLDEIRFSQGPMLSIDPMLLQPYDNDLMHSHSKNRSGITVGGPIRNNSVQKYLSDRDTVPDVMVSSNTAYGLTKDQLLTFTTNEMREYVKVANSTNNLTPVEKKELKRQKRLIKNRESAHLSRQRKRERLNDLEHRVEELSSTSVNITKTLTTLESENLVLKAEVGQLIEVIKDSPSLCALFFNNINNNQKAQELLSSVY